MVCRKVSSVPRSVSISFCISACMAAFSCCACASWLACSWICSSFSLSSSTGGVGGAPFLPAAPLAAAPLAAAPAAPLGPFAFLVLAARARTLSCLRASAGPPFGPKVPSPACGFFGGGPSRICDARLSIACASRLPASVAPTCNRDLEAILVGFGLPFASAPDAPPAISSFGSDSGSPLSAELGAPAMPLTSMKCGGSGLLLSAYSALSFSGRPSSAACSSGSSESPGSAQSARHPDWYSAASARERLRRDSEVVSCDFRSASSELICWSSRSAWPSTCASAALVAAYVGPRSKRSSLRAAPRGWPLALARARSAAALLGATPPRACFSRCACLRASIPRIPDCMTTAACCCCCATKQGTQHTSVRSVS